MYSRKSYAVGHKPSITIIFRADIIFICDKATYVKYNETSTALSISDTALYAIALQLSKWSNVFMYCSALWT